ncbi:hypothetical protein [Cohnella silvisoli]|uniref:DUF4015 domain-containing protein n=1 Tax=Cohnella silvisoli TaxID=2873699 RepID=A0ABV1KUV8_9BACL|nr:hypothetical protein [Cohnella silvisoli]MCD9023026.1 hypothetical protein [Cohnella silvisoli]
MRRDSFKLLILAGIVAFAVLYGMDLSSKGIANVNGPLSTESPSSETQTSADGEWTLPNTDKTQQSNKNEASSVARQPVDDTPFYNWDEEQLIPRNDRKPIVDRVSGTTAKVLHELSRNGIRMVVSLFDKVTG